MVLISVCIPSYNRAEELKELLDSVVKQNSQNFEIVIVEDKSPAREKNKENSKRIYK